MQEIPLSDAALAARLCRDGAGEESRDVLDGDISALSSLPRPADE